MLVGLKVWFVVHQQYVCEPKAKEAVRQFITNVASTSFDALSDKTMFVDKDQFDKFQQSFSENYAIEIKDWEHPVEPVVVVHFASKMSYAFMLVVGHDVLPTCWGTEYKVLTVR